MSTSLPDVERIRAIWHVDTAVECANAKVAQVLEIHRAANAGRLCVHCGELAEDHGNFTDRCNSPHTTKFEALRCQFEIPLNADGTQVEVCGARTVPGETFCHRHFDED